MYIADFATDETNSGLHQKTNVAPYGIILMCSPRIYPIVYVVGGAAFARTAAFWWQP